MVAMVKRLIGERQVGHAGTLDPAATGVLPVCFGRATRIIEFMADAAKTYLAEVELGITTDTYDAEGSITSKKDPAFVTGTALETALASFRGDIQQTPPMYSAVKHHGKPLYEMARAGIEIERKSRLAKIYSLELIKWQSPIATIEVVCGKGTYIRSLAYDLGQLLGCGAYLKSLVRTRYGIFDIKDAISADEFEYAARDGYWKYFAHPADAVLIDRTAVIVGEKSSETIRNGRPLIYPEPLPPQGYCRAYTLDGFFLAVMRFDSQNGSWHPEKVFT
jgi:tRNA pseudouridine55 synthase